MHCLLLSHLHHTPGPFQKPALLVWAAQYACRQTATPTPSYLSISSFAASSCPLSHARCSGVLICQSFRTQLCGQSREGQKRTKPSMEFATMLHQDKATQDCKCKPPHTSFMLTFTYHSQVQYPGNNLAYMTGGKSRISGGREVFP